MEERKLLILGALLHDIGKFIQRAEVEIPNEYEQLKTFCCPRGYSHLHVLLSGWFVNKFLNESFSKVENLVIYHHLPQNSNEKIRRLVKIIQLADWLSSSERELTEETETLNYKKQPIINVFSEVKNSEIDEQNIVKRFSPLRQIPLQIKKESFLQLNPVNNSSEAIGQQSYKNLWDRCSEDASNLKEETNFDLLVEKLLYLMESYTVFIPATTIDKPATSLYHHMKTTAAIAVCLYDIEITEEQIDAVITHSKTYKDFPEDTKHFIMVEGDISGIQNFIYSLTSKHALRGLKGRSLYLQLLSETIVNYLLEKLNLPKSNIIYSGGGNFQIIAPNTRQVKTIISELSNKIDRMLLSAHNGKLSCIIASEEFSYNSFAVEKFTDIVTKIKARLAREKRRKFQNNLTPNFFQPVAPFGEKECVVCGQDMPVGIESEECSMCKSFGELNRDVRNCKTINLQKIPLTEEVQLQPITDYKDVLKNLGYKYSFLPNKQANQNGLSYLINSSDFISKGFTGFKFENTYFPVSVDNQIFTLEDVALKSQMEVNGTKIGLKRWGVLRMDADNLGIIFSQWLKNPTISKYSQLSYSLSFFFKGYIESIVSENYKNCIIVYSGGDDLSIIAPWSTIPDLALEINNSFSDYTGNPHNLTLSGGIYIPESSGFPVYQAAMEAGEAEQMSKKAGRNRISFLNKTVTWNELLSVKQVKDELISLLESKDSENRVVRSILGVISALYQEKEAHSKDKIEVFKLWRFYYAIKRFSMRYKKDDIEQNRFAQRLINMFVTDYNIHHNLDVSVQWTDYLTRRER